jgi:hypothetical protein
MVFKNLRGREGGKQAEEEPYFLLLEDLRT